MKEAAGELTNTVVVLICVAILVAFFYFVIWPSIKTNFNAETACEKATCETTPDENGMVKCILYDKKLGKIQSFECKFKG